MDRSFWIGIFLGAIISIITSFFANLYTDNVREYLSRRRQIRLGNKKASELKIYAFVKRLTLGESLASLEMQKRRSNGLGFLALADTALIMAVLVAVSPGTLEKSTVTVLFATMLITGLVCLSLFLATFLSNSTTLRKAQEFARYESDIRHKWGDDAI